MPDIPQDEFMARLNAINPQPAVVPQQEMAPETGGISLPPATPTQMTNAALNMSASQLASPHTVQPSPWAEPDLASKLGARRGIPFDTDTGIPWLTRVTSEREPTKAEQVTALERAYGKDNVRLNSFGSPVVTTVVHGQTRDVLANPLGFDWGDTATLMASTPEIAGSVIPLLLSRGATLGPGILKALGTLGLTTAGSELTGAAKDMFLRWTQGDPVQPSEIAARRTVSGMEGFFLGAGMGVAGKALGTVISPFSNVGKLQFDARAAQQYFADKYGVQLPLSAGEATGSPLLLRGEAMESAKPGASTAFGKFKTQQVQAIQDLQRIATGQTPDPEQAGKNFLSAAGGAVAPLEFDVQKAAQATIDAASNELKAGVGTPVSKVTVGNSILAGAEAKRAAFKATDSANYDALFNHPKATANLIDADVIAKPMRDLMDKFPSVEETVTKPSGLLNQFGNPITTTQTSSRTLEKSVPSGLISRLQELASTSGGKISLDSLKSIRTDIGDAIATGEAIPGVKPGFLKAAYSSTTQAIQDGLSQINDPGLTKLWNTAKDFHAANVGQFQKVGIADLFRDPINALTPNELVTRATSGQKAEGIYSAYKDFFGPTSPQVQGVQQAVRDDVLGLSQLSKSVDAAGFARRIEQLDTDAPEVLKDVFGNNAQSLRSSAMAMQAAQGKTLPKDELVAAAQSGNLSGQRLTDMFAAQARQDNAYRNTLVKAISKGAVDPEKIQPTDVVNKLVFNKGTQPEHLEELMNMVSGNPQVTEDLKRLTFKRVLDDSTKTLPSGESTLSASKMDSILNDEGTRSRLTKVLGVDSFQDLEQFANFLRPAEVSQQAARSAGGMGAGAQIAGIWERGSLPYISRAVKNLALATVYTSAPLRKYFTNTALDAEGKANIVNLAITSTPFVSALTRTLTKEGAGAAMKELKHAVDTMAASNPTSMHLGQPTAGTEGMPWDQFLGKLQAIPGAGSLSQPTNAPVPAQP